MINKTDQNEMICERILELTRERKITVNELAKKSGIRQSTISSIINDGTIPRISTIEAIAKGFGISTIEFLDFKPYNSYNKRRT